MSTIDEQDLINRLTRRKQIGLVASVAGLLVWLIVVAITANAGHPPPPASYGDIFGWVVAAAAVVSLPLSVFLPRRWLTKNRRQIAAGTWYSQSRRWVDKSGELDELLKHEAIRSDRGQLAYVCSQQCTVGGVLLILPLWLAGMVYIGTKSPIALAVGVLLTCGLFARFPTRTRLANWIDRQEEALLQERELAVAKPPQGTRTGKGRQEPTNRPHRDDGSSGLEDEVCGWLMEGAAANDLDRPRELPSQERQAAGPQRQSSGAGTIANSTSDASAPPVDPAASLVATLKYLFAPAPGLDPWEKVRVSLAITLIYNVFIGSFVSMKLYVEDPKTGGWKGWLFLAPFILFGVGMLAAFVGRLIVAIKYTWAEKSSKSRRTRRRREIQVRSSSPGSPR